MPKCVSPGSEAAGARASWVALGQPRGTAAEHATSAAPPQSHSISLLLPGGVVFIICPLIRCTSISVCVRYYARRWGELFGPRGLKSLGLWNQDRLGSNSSPSTCSLCELERFPLPLRTSVSVSVEQGGRTYSWGYED